MDEDKNKEALTDVTSHEDEHEEELEVEDESVDEESTESNESSEDIDYHERELARLESEGKPKSKYTEEEKLIFNAKRIKQQMEEKGLDTSSVFGEKTPIVEAKISSSDEIEARLEQKLEARRLAKTDAERKVMLWYMENRGLDVHEAHILANKGKVQHFMDEYKRSSVRAERGSVDSGSPQRPKKTPELSPNEQADLTRQGFKKQKDGSWEGAKMRVFYDKATKSWKSSRK